MRKIISTTFMTLDGVMQAPGGPEEDTAGGFTHGGWTANFWDDPMGRIMDGFISQPFDLLLGKRTYEIFASYWPTATTDLLIAEKFNSTRKYVVSHTPMPLPWHNSFLISGDVPAALKKLKHDDRRSSLQEQGAEVPAASLPHRSVPQVRNVEIPVTSLLQANIVQGNTKIAEGTKDLWVHGSGDLIQTLLAHKLLDRMHVWTFPVTVGAGKRLFASGSLPLSWKLISSQASPKGVVISTYEPAGELKTGMVGDE